MSTNNPIDAESEKSINDEFIYRIVHDLKAPIRGVQNLVQWIKEDFDSGDQQAILTNIELLDYTTKRIHLMMDALKLYAELDNMDDPKEDFNPLINIGHIISFHLKGKQMKHEITGDLNTVVLPTKKLIICLREIVKNAIKFNTNRHPQLAVRVLQSNQSITFHVKDNGPGIPDYIKDQIFNFFTSTEPKEGVEFIGAGLAIAHKAAKVAQGVLEINSNSTGTEVKLIWPTE